MRIAVQADEGDEFSISADFVSVEQGVVTLEIENASYKSEIQIEAVTLTVDKAGELANALLSVVDAIEFVSAPVNLFDLTTNYPFEVKGTFNSLSSRIAQRVT